PVVMAPAMHTEMWLHPATQANVATLRSRGVVVLNPGVGRLTGADSGPGRLPEPEDIEASCLAALAVPAAARAMASQDLAGTVVVISAGGTREAIDPVRYLGNASSGLMGVALARAAVQRGAEVTLVAANLQVQPPAGVEVVEVVSTADLARAMAELAPAADIVVMAAAPADYTPTQPSAVKLKKSGDAGLVLEFGQTTDVLAGLAARRPSGQVVVGFAAETATDEADLLALGIEKLARKGCQLLVLNNVSAGAVFGAQENEVLLLSPAGLQGRSAGTKTTVAHAILTAALAERMSP
ncbi:MAG: bifunctional phosphopantothenoylcysteine decarboxylase/phosphopantothenate--cysteine ligase CoaBC, partial [Propionicimonas sp.]